MYMHVCMISHFQFFVTLRTIACQATLSMKFSRQEHWSRLPCPPAGDLHDPWIKPTSLCLLHFQAGSLLLAPPWKLFMPIMTSKTDKFSPP